MSRAGGALNEGVLEEDDEALAATAQRQLVELLGARDGYRAARRQQMVVTHLAQIRGLGNFTTAAKYLLASLLTFQNLDEALKAQLNAIVNDYEKQTLPEDIKYLALGFVFLTVVGEAHYETVLNNAIQIQTKALPQNLPQPGP